MTDDRWRMTVLNYWPLVVGCWLLVEETRKLNLDTQL